MSAAVILTRPRHRNTDLARRLSRDAATVLSLPALELAPLVSSPTCVPAPDGFDVVVFVSGYASRLYLHLLRSGKSPVTWPAGTLAATVGQASADSLYQSGFIPHTAIIHPEGHSQAQDSEALWELLEKRLPRPKNVLILRGETGREWLGARLELAGAQVTRFSLYRRRPAIWSDAQGHSLARALQDHSPAICLLTSSESVTAVHVNVQRFGLLESWARCRFLVIHERISARLHSILHESGVRSHPSITQCAPSDDAIYEAIRSLTPSMPSPLGLQSCHD